MEKANMTEAQRRTDNMNKKKNAVSILFRLYKSTDADIIEFLKTIPNRQGLIKQLLREHMKSIGQ